ncbi:unnamed protein product [Protopolystoma xenopodis]|uniref:Uncharacterized protein n=1 Tax=Protopolystoma xenopodis TaxID=117903 RepID=A0A448WHS1_9PLAT|nr:unnamed protein product [Protopolystoma xenopodis]
MPSIQLSEPIRHLVGSLISILKLPVKELIKQWARELSATSFNSSSAHPSCVIIIVGVQVFASSQACFTPVVLFFP